MSSGAPEEKTCGKILRESPLKDRLALLLSTVMGVGFLPRAPGTFGTLAACPFPWFMAGGSVFLRAGVLCVLAAVAVWAGGRYSGLVGREDPPEVVLDEVVGFLAAALWVPLTWWGISVCFFLFRIFDILKPFPIKSMERTLPGGWGIVADDVAAGLYALAATRLVLLLAT